MSRSDKISVSSEMNMMCLDSNIYFLVNFFAFHCVLIQDFVQISTNLYNKELIWFMITFFTLLYAFLWKKLKTYLEARLKL